MRRKTFVYSENIVILVVLIFLIFADNLSLANEINSGLRPPIETDDSTSSPSTKQTPKSGENTRKSSKLDETSQEQQESDEYSFTTSSAIKIVKGPDLSKESENGEEKFKDQVNDFYNQFMKNDLDASILDDPSLFAEEEEPPKELTPEEMEAERLFQSAMAILNKTRGDKEIGHSVLADAARRGHPIAKVKIAWAQLLGHHPVPLNTEKARETFTELAEKGLPEAHMGLGFMYASGIGKNVSQAKAILHYTFAALGDNTWAQMAMGYRYWGGIGVRASCEQALEFYQRVAKKVASEVTFSGGTALHRIRLLDEVENSGSNSGILDNDLIDYYQLLADKGDVQAQVGLGQLHYQGGRGVPLDHQKALHYFQQAANAGNAIAMAFLGKMYLEGSEHIKADNETALKYFTRAADLGNPVGKCCFFGFY